jgi:hypothetical protein
MGERDIVERLRFDAGADEIERLTTENWQLKGALGYRVPGHIMEGDFKCGLCAARTNDVVEATAEIGRLRTALRRIVSPAEVRANNRTGNAGREGYAMTDIIERLRGVRGGWTDISCAAVEALCSEAAGEIELLRADAACPRLSSAALETHRRATTEGVSSGGKAVLKPSGGKRKGK